MGISTTTRRMDYIGDGATATYPYNFKIFQATDLKVLRGNLAGVSTTLVLNTDYTVAGVGNKAGGSITLSANLTNGFKLVIAGGRAIKQTTDIRNQGEYFPATIEDTFDKGTIIDQQIQEQVDRSIKLNPLTTSFDATLPAILEADRTIIVGPTGTSLVLGPTPAELQQAGADVEGAEQAAEDAAAALAAINELLKPGGDAGSVLTKQTGDDNDTRWKQYSYSGFSARFGSNFASTTLDDTLSQILNLQYAGPLVSLSAAGSGTIREKGTAVTSVGLTASVTKRSNNIGAVRFYKDAVLINTVASPSPSGGNETFTWTGSFTDNVTFSTQVDDVAAGGNGPTTVSSSANFTFVYPYYVGAGASGLSASSVAGLTKLTIGSTATLVRSITAAGGNVFYFAYPASYGALTSILDVNNFETIGDWTASTSNITGLDGAAVSYRIYEFKNPVTAGSYQYTFKR